MIQTKILQLVVRVFVVVVVVVWSWSSNNNKTTPYYQTKTSTTVECFVTTSSSNYSRSRASTSNTDDNKTCRSLIHDGSVSQRLSFNHKRRQRQFQQSQQPYYAAASSSSNVSDGFSSTDNANSITSVTVPTNDVVMDFISKVKESLKYQTLVDLKMSGIKGQEKEALRGKLKVLYGRLVALKPKKKKKRRSNSSRTNKGAVVANNNANNGDINVVLQMTLKYYLSTDIVKNFMVDDIEQEVKELICEADHNIQGAELKTVGGTSYKLKRDPSGWKLTRTVPRNKGVDDDTNGPTPTKTPTTAAAVVVQSHDRVKNVPLSIFNGSNNSHMNDDDSGSRDVDENDDEHSIGYDNHHDNTSDNNDEEGGVIFFERRQQQQPSEQSLSQQSTTTTNKENRYLQLLGILNAQGQVRPTMKAKLKQCQKFVEILDKLVEKQLSDQHTAVSITDMGCGRGYLTFALHKYLSDKFASKIKILSKGIEIRQSLVDQTNGFCQELGAPFDTLEFVQGSITNVMMWNQAQQEDEADTKTQQLVTKHSNGASSSTLQVLIALHACDTATDDALWYALTKQMDIIVVAPCCHKQLRSQIDAYFKHSSDSPLSAMLRYGIYRERHSESATDTIRGLLLELSGYYDVQIFEFISADSTGKNSMITAVRRKRRRTSKQLEDLNKQLQDVCQFHGIHTHELATHMNLSLLN